MSRAQKNPLGMIPWAKPDFWGLEKQYVTQALDSTWISGGPFVDRIEQYFSTFTQRPYAVTASNGTTALHMAYLAIGIAPGDEIVAPGFAFQACANLAIQMGAKPVFAEVDPETWCLDARCIEPCLTSRTRLIAVVHSYGNLCDMDGILQLATDRGICVLEDAAEAFASTWNGRQAGAIAPIGSFSFQATKTISTGEGGMVVTENSEWAQKMRLYRSHGMLKKRYWHEVAGHNFRLTNLQAALGCAQFERLEEILRHRNRVHNRYRTELVHATGLQGQRFLPQVKPVLWAMAVKLDPRAYPQGRDIVMEQMAAAGIETRPGFYCPSEMPLYQCPPLRVCQELSRQVISLPTYSTLSDQCIEFTCKTLKKLQR